MGIQSPNQRTEEMNETKREVQRLILDISIVYGELWGDWLNFQTAKDAIADGVNLKDRAQEEFRLSRISFLSLMSSVFSICENDVEPGDVEAFNKCMSILESQEVDKQLEDMDTIRLLKSTSLKVLNNSRLSCLTDRTKIDDITAEIDISEM